MAWTLLFSTCDLISSKEVDMDHPTAPRKIGRRTAIHGMAVANPWFGKPAAEEVRREVRRVVKDLGLYGLKFVLMIQGYPLSQKGMAVVAEEAIDLNVPVTLHDGSAEYSSASPESSIRGILWKRPALSTPPSVIRKRRCGWATI
jgi:hypothetical protein